MRKAWGGRGLGLVVAAAGIAGSSPAWACAGIVHDAESLVESDGGEVVFELGDGEVAATYAVTYEGSAADFGWVIPVPGDVSAVEDGSIGLVEQVREQSKPLVDVVGDDPGPSGCQLGCGGAAKAGGDSLGTRSNGSVTIEGEGFTGTYDYTLVSATDAGALQAWFDDNGWVGIPAADLDTYIASGATFVALHISDAPTASDVSTGAGSVHLLPPVRITYPGDEAVFPAVMARNASVPTQRTSLYVIGPTRAAITAGWAQDDTTELSGVEGVDDAAAMYDELLGSIGDGGGYLRSYAGAFDDGRTLTRFDTLAPREVHQQDVVIGLEASTDPIRFTITLQSADAGTSGSQALLVLGLGLGAVIRRRART